MTDVGYLALLLDYNLIGTTHLNSNIQAPSSTGHVMILWFSGWTGPHSAGCARGSCAVSSRLPALRSGPVPASCCGHRPHPALRVEVGSFWHQPRFWPLRLPTEEQRPHQVRHRQRWKLLLASEGLISICSIQHPSVQTVSLCSLITYLHPLFPEEPECLSGRYVSLSECVQLAWPVGNMSMPSWLQNQEFITCDAGVDNSYSSTLSTGCRQLCFFFF